jgi:hypothetical protein
VYWRPLYCTDVRRAALAVHDCTDDLEAVLGGLHCLSWLASVLEAAVAASGRAGESHPPTLSRRSVGKKERHDGAVVAVHGAVHDVLLLHIQAPGLLHAGAVELPRYFLQC